MSGDQREEWGTLSIPLSLIVRLEQAWQSGGRPVLADWVLAHAPISLDVLVDLIRVDQRRRFGAEDAWKLEEYFAAFPALLQNNQLAASVIQEEIRLLRAAQESAPVEEYARRFPLLSLELTSCSNSEVVRNTAFESPPMQVPGRNTSPRPGKDEQAAEETLSFVQHPNSTRPPSGGNREFTSGEAAEGQPRIAGYEILGYVAKGGMGVVYKARDKVLGRTVALKMPRPGYVESEQDKVRFFREARAAARLRHANICPLYEVRESEGRPYICMAFIEGETLKAWAAKERPGPRQVAELVATLSRAVQYAHEQGVVHRDLKPSNVMVESGSSQPLLMDFGLAKDLSQEEGLTISGEVLGTPAYMAPEQAAGKVHELGPSVDIYSLGAMLYELISGQPPFRGSVVELLLKVQSEEPRSLRRLMPNIHIDLETICQKAMAKQAADRYPTAAAFADDLDRFAQGEAILARRQSLWQRSRRIFRKYPLAIGLGTTALVAVLLLLALTPALGRNWQLSQLTARLEAELSRPNWSPQNLPELDALAMEIGAFAPEQAADHRRRIASRLDAYVGSYLNPNRGKWSQEDWEGIEFAVRELENRDPEAAQQRQAEADRLRGLPQRVADLRPPWKSFSEILPGLRLDEKQNVLRVGTPKGDNLIPMLSLANQASEGEFQIEAEFDLPAQGTVGLVLNAKTMHPSITGLAIHPNGETFASAGTDGGAIRIWDAASGAELFQLPGHEQGIRSLAYSPDGRWLVSTGFDERAKVWELKGRKLAHTLPFVFRNYPGGTAVLLGPPGRFSPDGTRLFVGCADGEQGGEIRVWSVPGFTPLPALKTASTAVVFLEMPASGGKLFAGTIDGQLYVWDTANGKLLRKFSMPVPNLTSLAVDDAGNRVAAANSMGLIHVFDELGAAQHSLQGFAAGVYSLAFDPHGKGQILAAGYEDGHVKIWDLSKQQVQRTSSAVDRRCSVLVYAASGGWGLAGSEAGVIQRLDMTSCAERYRLSSQQYEFRVSHSADGHWVRLQSRRNGTLLRSVEQSVAAGPIKLAVRRKDELVGMQVNSNPEVIFRDFFPPVSMEGGQWGILLSPESGLKRLLARRRLLAATGSPLERGDSLFNHNELSEALDFFDQQIAIAAGDNAVDVRQEAQLKAAFCLLRLNRLEEAETRLQELAAQGSLGKPAGMVALFQIWLLRLQQQRFDDANGLFHKIRVTELPDDILTVIAADTQQQILRSYDASLRKRKLLMEPGMVPRLEAALAVHEFFKVAEDETGDLRWRCVEAQRLLGKTDDTIALEKLAHGLEARLRPPASPAEINVETLDTWSRYAQVCRMMGKAQRAEILYDTQLLDGGGKLRQDVKGQALGLLLERARLHAFRLQWTDAQRCLDQLLSHPDVSQVPRPLLIKTHLLRGFVFRNLAQEQESQAAWREGCQKLNLQVTDMTQIPITDAGLDQFLDALILGTLGDCLDDAALQQALDKVQGWISSLSGVADVLPSVSPPPATLRLAWRSPKGQAISEQIARGDLTSGERVAGLIKLIIGEMMRQGAFSGTPSAPQDDVVWRFCEGGTRAHFQGQMKLTAVIQIGLVWKGAPNLFGWPATVEAVPPAIQPEMAYILAHRCLSRGRKADAKQLLELAMKLQAEGLPVHVLAKSELGQLKND